MLEQIYIENYLSVGKEQKLKITNRLTTLIGKNAVGKSSILKAIEKLNGIAIKKKEKNINLRESETKISARFRINSNELKHKNKMYKLKYPNEVLSIIDTADLIYELKLNEDGTLEHIYQYDNSKYYISFEIYFLNLLVKRIKKIIELCTNDKFVETLKIDNSNVLNTIDLLDKLSDDSKELISEDLKTEILTIINEYNDSKDFLIPKYKFVYMNSFKDLLVDEISVDSIESNSTVLSFLKIAKITPDEIRQALDSSDNQLISTITNKTVSVVTEDFRKIFSQVSNDDKFKISMSIDSANRKLCFWIQNNMTDQSVIPFSEESEGMQWYLSMYLKLHEYLENSEENCRYILLLDEPNIYLHAAAQCDLLNKVFKEKLNDIQIIYSTHSPYMIDSEDLFSLRIVDKREQTYIYNTTIDYLKEFKNGENINDVDVLSPVLISTGISITNQLIPSNNDRIVVVEGPHDFYMLNAMIYILGLTKRKYKIIPCNGASKVPFMCGYLYGMGFKIVALLDNDRDGKKAIDDLKYLNDTESYISSLFYQKSNRENVILENMFSNNDLEEYMSVKSTINYRKIYDNRKTIKFEKETKDNFAHLFIKLEEKFK